MKKEELKVILSVIDKKKFDVIISESKGNYKIDINKKFVECCVCKSEKHYKTLTLRQDRRVKFLMVSKLICRTCLPQVNFILNNLKDSVSSPLDTGRW